ncbi:hypothetical protein ACI7BZ_03680 [Xanthobacter sp. AM11]|uniref:hypothetical protein n=1 Tax=Xanthobacter sp. AM11 TaxID=3380643 RepID=UPI0039BF49EF
MQFDSKGSETAEGRDPTVPPMARLPVVTPEQLRQHPRFDEALHLSAGGLVRLSSGNRIFNRLLADKGRAVFAHFILYLHALPESAGGGLTAARMGALCAEMNICSRGRARALLALMRWAGHVAPLEAATDRRERPLAPTEAMVSLQRERWRIQYGAVSLLDPAMAAVPAALEHMVFFNHLALSMGRCYRAGFRLLDVVPALALIIERDGGVMVLNSLLVRGNEGAPPPAVAELARNFHISRAQVLHVLRVAEAEGLLTRGDVGAGRLTPQGRDALGGFYAGLFTVFINCAHEALYATRGRI